VKVKKYCTNLTVTNSAFGDVEVKKQCSIADGN